ncbi:MAG: hypothetical protein ACI312_01825 [Bacilli bacterium]
MNNENEVIEQLNELIGYCDNEIKQKEDINETIDSLNEVMGYGKLDNTYQKRKELKKIKSKKIELKNKNSLN